MDTNEKSEGAKARLLRWFHREKEGRANILKNLQHEDILQFSDKSGKKKYFLVKDIKNDLIFGKSISCRGEEQTLDLDKLAGEGDFRVYSPSEYQ